MFEALKDRTQSKVDVLLYWILYFGRTIENVT